MIEVGTKFEYEYPGGEVDTFIVEKISIVNFQRTGWETVVSFRGTDQQAYSLNQVVENMERGYWKKVN